MTSAKNSGLVGDKHEPETEKGFQKKIANSISDIIASAGMEGIRNTGRTTWVGFLLILFAFVYIGTNPSLDVKSKVFIMLTLMYAYQCIVIVISALSKIAQKLASILGILAMFTVSYEESGLNVMKAFFDGISKAAEPSETENEQAKTEVENC